MSHRYFRAVIAEWEITTVITVKTPALDVETLEVRITDEWLGPIYNTNSFHKNKCEDIYELNLQIRHRRRHFKLSSLYHT